MLKILTVKEVEYLSHRLAQRVLKFNEPIPDFSTRYPDKLESCLATPFQRFSGKDLYPSFLDKASILLYLMIKNHPFQNGNKRVAITTLLLFLYKNGKWLKVDPFSFYRFTMWVADSPPDTKDAMVLGIRAFLKLHIVNI